MAAFFALGTTAFAGILVHSAHAAPWKPDLVTVKKLDERVATSRDLNVDGCESAKITDFGRYYFGSIDNRGHHHIVGQLLLLKYFPDAQAGIHVQPLDLVVDAHCRAALVNFDVDGKGMIGVFRSR